MNCSPISTIQLFIESQVVVHDKKRGEEVKGIKRGRGRGRERGFG